MAVQISLKRLVALKMLLAAAPASAQALVRFRSEAETLARLHDPRIVLVYDVGECDGQPYLSMEYVTGPNLARRLSGKAQEPLASAWLVETLARAVHSVHHAGIVHRDLKPANVLLEPKESSVAASKEVRPLTDYLPKITDFGLAKDFATDRRLTQSGVTMGTPCYMAPEQATGEGKVGPAADIYALGAILYEMLTGRPPFEADTVIATITQVIHDTPLSPLRLRPTLPHDLVTICMKCLEKPPQRRYVSALGLAEDLRRFQVGEPIHARPVSWWERGYRWCRRRPLVAGLIGLCAGLLVAFIVTVIVYEIRLQDALQRAETRGDVEQRQIVDLNLQVGIVEVNGGDELAGVLRFAEALRQTNAPAKERELRTRIGGVLDQTPRLLRFDNLGKRIACAAAAADGGYLVTGDEQGLIEVWDLEKQGKPVASQRAEGQPAAVAINRDGRFAAAQAPDGKATLWDLKTGQAKDLGPLRAQWLEFDRDNSILITRDAHGTIQRWDAATGKAIHLPVLAAGERLAGASADGRWLLTIDQSNAARVRQALSGEAREGKMPLLGPVADGAVSTDGRRLAVLGTDGAVSIWDVPSARKLGETVLNKGDYERATFSGDGRFIALTSRFLDTRLWRVEATRLVSENGISGRGSDWTEFSPDGESLLSAEVDGRARVWYTRTRERATPALGRGGLQAFGVVFAAFRGGGQQLLTVSGDGTVWFWRLPRPLENVGGSVYPLDRRPATDLLQLAELLSGRRIDQREGEAWLSPSELQARWEDLKERLTIGGEDSP